MWSANEERLRELQRKYYYLDRSMKEVHKKGYYLTKVTYPLSQDLFDYLAKFDRNHKDEVIKDNLLELSILALGEYVGNGRYLTSKDGEARRMLKEMFMEYAPYLPTEDVPYYKKMIEENPIMYYSEFVDFRSERQISEGVSSGLSKQYVKKTEAGSSYFEEDNSLNSNAFVRIFLIPAYVVAATLFMALAYFILQFS